MTNRSVSPATALDAWQGFWFARIPPHVYALLRMALGFVGVLTMLELSDLGAFWHLSGFVSDADGGLGVKSFLLARGWGDSGGTVLYLLCLGIYVCMTIGLASGTTVALGLIAALFQLSWNYLPLSGAHQAFQAFLFCLIWADCGSVWSVDAWLARRRGEEPTETPTSIIAPLRLIRLQVAMIYLSSGCWKLMNPLWRDGSAVHYVLNNNAFQRFPGGVPFGLEGLATLATYGTLFWELGFAFMILFTPTRRVALWAGVFIHINMMLLLEIGPFHLVMLASYLAFLDPEQAARLSDRIAARISPLRHRQA